MGIWVILLWVIASLMACWSFSLFVRWVSEAVARRRKRLVAQRSARSFWLGLVLMFVCATVALFAAAMAIHLEILYTDSYDRWTTPVAIIAGSVGLFGVFVLVWAIIGDRPRGRVRCPKCWYDMSDAAGLQCPECGRTAKSARQFKRSRRARWAFVVAIGMFGLSGYGFSVHRRVAETDWFAAVPSWVLMAGWDWLPEEWILSQNSPYESTLEDRLDSSWDDVNWFSYSRRRRFGQQLAKGMFLNADDRWDIRRLELIESVNSELTHGPRVYLGGNRDREWISPSIDADRLLRLSARDMLDAITEENPVTIKISNEGPYYLARSWIRADIQSQTAPNGHYDESGELDMESYEKTESLITAHLKRAISGLEERLLSDAFRVNLTSNDGTRRGFSMTLAGDAGILGQLQDEFLDAAEAPLKMELETRAAYLGYFSNEFSAQEKQQLLDNLDAMFSSDDLGVRAHALTVFQRVQRSQKLNEQNGSASYLENFEHAIDLAIDNHTRMYPNDVKRNETFFSIGLDIMLRHNLNGEQAYPFILNELLADPDGAPPLPLGYDPFGPTSHIKAWVENFAQLADDDDPDIKRWLIENLPIELGTEYDDLLDQIAVGFLDDPDGDIRLIAQQKLMERLAEHLLTQ